MQRVFVLGKNREPLMPCHPARARQLLKQGRAAVFRQAPFTIILTDREDGALQPLQVKIDPGSRTTGIAVVQENERGKRVVWSGELHHRGTQVKSDMDSRRALRQSRRSRKTRYRPPRFNNRRRREGWLPPSLQSCLDNIVSWLDRLYRWTPLTGVSVELARFDTQQMENPEINGVEYQQGTLYGYEVREYLLEKWGRKCAYCGVDNVPLEVEHIVPRSRGGSDRVSNLTLACTPCNQRKNNQTAAEFGYPDIQRQAQRPLKDAAAVNAARWALYRCLAASGLSLEVGTGSRTKFNRIRQHYPKTHWTDAACVGESGGDVYIAPGHAPLVIIASGRGSRQMCGTDKYGFPIRHRTQQKQFFGFQTGDRVRAVVTKGKKQGVYIGRVLCRKSGNFDIRTATGRVQGINHRYCTPLHKSDGYRYEKGAALSSTAVKTA